LTRKRGNFLHPNNFRSFVLVVRSKVRISFTIIPNIPFHNSNTTRAEAGI
jgi:hypothetical protein